MPNLLWATLKQKVREGRRVLLTSSGVAGLVIFVQMSGLLQTLEWAALDQAFRLRPLESPDQRIVIVGINEADLRKIGQWPVPDAVMAELLQKVAAFQPRAIGLDIYRDLPVEPGHTALVEQLKDIPNLVGIEKIQDKQGQGVAPAPVLEEREQTGFNNIVIDSDGKVRRSLLYLHDDNEELHESFALKLSLLYLQAEGIRPQPAPHNPRHLQLNRAVFRRFQPNDAAYVKADGGGYQILSNFRGPAGSFLTVSVAEVLSGQIAPDLMRDRIVLIGSTATSIKDIVYTPYSNDLINTPQEIFGVELQANFVSEILSAALNDRPLIRFWPAPLQWVWIFGWSWVGASLCWRLRSPRRSAVSTLLAGSGLTSIYYLAFFNGWWLPFATPIIALAGSAVVIIGHIAQQEEELKRSKDFLQKVINTIPDPIFVKDRHHRWVVLNEAYCQFIGHPLNALLEKTDYDFLPQEEADVSWDQDSLTFNSGESHENEEKFTSASGVTRLIATKRSLHKDAAGNLFLVGIIRDITERKRMEEELKRTANELARYNAELRTSEDRLRQLAYHDPLTGLPNRKLFYERLSQAIEWGQTTDQLVALLFLDLDGFKSINDTLGHDGGDLLLKAVAQRLTGCLRGSDTVARLGGDEFTVILPGIPGVQDVAKVADKIITTLARPFVLADRTVLVTTSIGISLYPVDGTNLEVLIKSADTAMYRAKELGKSQYAFF